MHPDSVRRERVQVKQLSGQRLKNFLRATDRPPVALAFVLQDVEDPVNVGAAFRIADATGAREIVLAGTTPTPPDQTIHGVGRGAHRRIPWRHVPAAADAVRELAADGYVGVAVEVADGAVPYYLAGYPDRVCLVVGNEHHGVSRRTLAECGLAVYVPMYGKLPSLNVHVALGIVAYHALHAGAAPGATP